MAERKSFSEKKLFAWLIIEDLIPEIQKMYLENDSIAKIIDCIENSQALNIKKNALELLQGTNEVMDSELSIEEIRTIKGL